MAMGGKLVFTLSGIWRRASGPRTSASELLGSFSRYSKPQTSHMHREPAGGVGNRFEVERGQGGIRSLTLDIKQATSEQCHQPKTCHCLREVACRPWSEESLVESLAARFVLMLQNGTTVVEVKSGYGCGPEEE